MLEDLLGHEGILMRCETRKVLIKVEIYITFIYYP